MKALMIGAQLCTMVVLFGTADALEIQGMRASFVGDPDSEFVNVQGTMEQMRGLFEREGTYMSVAIECIRSRKICVMAQSSLWEPKEKGVSLAAHSMVFDIREWDDKEIRATVGGICVKYALGINFSSKEAQVEVTSGGPPETCQGKPSKKVHPLLKSGVVYKISTTK